MGLWEGGTGDGGAQGKETIVTFLVAAPFFFLGSILFFDTSGVNNFQLYTIQIIDNLVYNYLS